MIEQYGYDDPNTNDNPGIFTGEDYGWYFTEKYDLLVERASISVCGKVASDNADIVKLYNSLLDGSDSRLEAYVTNIEKYIGTGNYQARVLSQEQVGEILDR